MIVVRYATLVALVFWLGAMTGVRFGAVVRRIDLVGYACGGAMLVGLLVMKFLGPPPRSFFVRAGVALVMLALAAGASFAGRGEVAGTLLTVNLVLGFSLLIWYVRE
jgi:hypothetical protein